MLDAHRFLLLLSFFLRSFSFFHNDGLVAISYPKNDQVVQGIVEVRGSIPEDAYETAELTYSYSDADVKTWFLIDSISKTGNETLLARWDTTTISDGNYDLRLLIVNPSGIMKEVVVTGIKVMNYTRPENVVPASTEVAIMTTSVPTQTQPTELVVSQDKKNSASISEGELTASLIIGATSAVSFLVFLILYHEVKKHASRR